MTTNTPAAQQSSEALKLADEIVDAINELAAGAVYPDLLNAVRRLAALASQQAAQRGPLNDAMACADLCEEITRRKCERFFGQQISDGSAEQCARAIRYMFGITAQGGSADAPGSLYDLSDKGFVDINKGGSKS